MWKKWINWFFSSRNLIQSEMLLFVFVLWWDQMTFGSVWWMWLVRSGHSHSGCELLNANQNHSFITESNSYFIYSHSLRSLVNHIYGMWVYENGKQLIYVRVSFPSQWSVSALCTHTRVPLHPGNDGSSIFVCVILCTTKVFGFVWIFLA